MFGLEKEIVDLDGFIVCLESAVICGARITGKHLLRDHVTLDEEIINLLINQLC